MLKAILNAVSPWGRGEGERENTGHFRGSGGGLSHTPVAACGLDAGTFVGGHWDTRFPALSSEGEVISCLGSQRLALSDG